MKLRRNTLIAVVMGSGFVVSMTTGNILAADTPAAAAADNAAHNSTIVENKMPTAMSQSNVKGDVELAAKVRRAIVGDKSLSTYAHNVKVITNKGSVYLAGPVRDDAERKTVAKLATEIAGDAQVHDNLELAPK